MYRKQLRCGCVWDLHEEVRKGAHRRGEAETLNKVETHEVEMQVTITAASVTDA